LAAAPWWITFSVVCLHVILVVWASVAEIFYCKKCVGSKLKTTETQRHVFKWHLNVHLKNATFVKDSGIGNGYQRKNS
jgi:hypothetical protein